MRNMLIFKQLVLYFIGNYKSMQVFINILLFNTYLENR